MLTPHTIKCLRNSLLLVVRSAMCLEELQVRASVLGLSLIELTIYSLRLIVSMSPMSMGRRVSCSKLRTTQDLKQLREVKEAGSLISPKSYLWWLGQLLDAPNTKLLVLCSCHKYLQRSPRYSIWFSCGPALDQLILFVQVQVVPKKPLLLTPEIVMQSQARQYSHTPYKKIIKYFT